MQHPENNLFSMVRAAIPDFDCPKHHRQYSLIDHNFNILCDSCQHTENVQQLNTFFQKPIVGLIQHFSPTMQIQEELLDRNFLAKIRKNLRQSEHALNTYLTSLEKAVLAQIKFMKETYEKLSKNNVTKIQQNLTYLETTNKIYLDHFEQKLGTTELNNSESLAQLIKEFVTGSEDPSSSLQLRIQNIKSLVKDFPFLKFQELKKLYVETCDPGKWQLGRFMQNTFFEQDLVIETNLTKLLDRMHLLRYEKDKFQILDLKNKLIGRTLGDIDSCFEIPQFRIISHNHSSIEVYSYLNPSSPKVLTTINAKYPTQIKYCAKSDSLFFISEGKLQKYSFSTEALTVVFTGKVKQYKLKDKKEMLLRLDRAYWKYEPETGKNSLITKEQWAL